MTRLDWAAAVGSLHWKIANDDGDDYDWYVDDNETYLTNHYLYSSLPLETTAFPFLPFFGLVCTQYHLLEVFAIN